MRTPCFSLSPGTGSDEKAILRAFDTNRARIMDAARKVVHRTAHPFIHSCVLPISTRDCGRCEAAAIQKGTGSFHTAMKWVRCWISVLRRCVQTVRRVRAGFLPAFLTRADRYFIGCSASANATSGLSKKRICRLARKGGRPGDGKRRLCQHRHKSAVGLCPWP